jgi:hypothetical protein
MTCNVELSLGSISVEQLPIVYRLSINARLFYDTTLGNSMDSIQTSSESASAVAWAPVLATVILAVCATIAIGVAAVYRKSQDQFLRSLSRLVVVGIVLVVITILAGVFEIIGSSASGFAVIAIIAILGTAFWVMVLADAAIKEPSEGNDKIVWVIVIIFTTVIGASLYLALRRPHRPVETDA